MRAHCGWTTALAIAAGAAAGSSANGRIGYLRPLGGNETPYGHLFAVNSDGGGTVDITPAGYTDILELGMVSRRPDRLLGDPGGRQRSRALRDERCRWRRPSPDRQSPRGLPAELVSERPLDRVHEHPYRALADLPDALRRQRPAAADECLRKLRLTSMVAARGLRSTA
jgi:hypothetical protein